MATNTTTTASSSAAGFSQALSSVTSVKLRALATQRVRLKSHCDAVISSSASPPPSNAPLNLASRIAALEILLAGVKDCPVSGVFDHVPVDVIQDVVDQAKVDASIGATILDMWSAKILQAMKEIGVKYDHAMLFGSTISEWLAQEGGKPSKTDAEDSDFVKEGRKEKFETQATLEAIIFEKSSVEVAPYRAFLCNLFDEDPANDFETIDGDVPNAIGRARRWNKATRGRGNSGRGRGAATSSRGREIPEDERKILRKNAIKNLREGVRDFGYTLAKERTVVDADVVNCLNGVLAQDLLDNDGRETCKEIKASPGTVSEIASVMNLMLRDIANWSWPEEGVNLVLRRALNGKYRCYIDEEVLTALFLHFIGTEWAVFLKKGFKEIAQSAVWKSTFKELSVREAELREAIVSDYYYHSSLSTKRKEDFLTNFFMTPLPESAEAVGAPYDASAEETRETAKAVGPAKIKQYTIQQILLAAKLSQVTRPESDFTVVQADLKWFGPQLSHDVLLESLRFCGMPKLWLDFILRFLQVPSKFHPTDAPRTRVRGVPISHVLSTLLAESTLFFMEFAVNQRTDGINMMRLHDDFWLVDEDAKRCETAWNVMNDFLQVTGIEFNPEKCGSCRIFGPNHPEWSNGTVPSALPLPQLPVRWGFLVLHSDGQFRIDQENVNEHIAEMRVQLAATNSVLGFINAYNKYTRFLVRNFGEPVQLMGIGHIEEVIASVSRVHRELFPDTHGSVLAHVRNKLIEQQKKTFGGAAVQEPSEAWITMPMTFGGLQLYNPLMELHALLRSYREQAKARVDYKMTKDTTDCVTFEEALEVDRLKHADGKIQWEKRVSFPDLRHLFADGEKEYEDTDRPVKMEDVQISGELTYRRPRYVTFEEFARARPFMSSFQHWVHALEKLQEIPEPVLPEEPEFEWDEKAPLVEWSSMSTYWKCVLAFTGDQLVEVFGKVSFLEKELIPLSMVESFMNKKVEWDQ